jgi:non-heme chloroperoxidase
MMSTISNGPVTLHVDDSGGDGRPVVLIHGWPLSGASWSAQVPALTGAGFRVVTYDRRGFGRSDKPGADSAYDYDTLTGDLDAVMTGLDLRDATLVGFSMGGGEVARYLGTHGAERVRSAVFAAAIPPCLKLDGDHPDGALDDDTVRGMQAGLEADPPGFLDGFTRNFFSADGELKVTEAQQQEALGLALQADVHAARECIASWTTDFTEDLATITVPTLVIHGDSDGIVPIEKSGQLTQEQVAGSELHVVEGGPHGINTSHTEEFNRELLAFLQR